MRHSTRHTLWKVNVSQPGDWQFRSSLLAVLLMVGSRLNELCGNKVLKLESKLTSRSVAGLSLIWMSGLDIDSRKPWRYLYLHHPKLRSPADCCVECPWNEGSRNSELVVLGQENRGTSLPVSVSPCSSSLQSVYQRNNPYFYHFVWAASIVSAPKLPDIEWPSLMPR